MFLRGATQNFHRFGAGQPRQTVWEKRLRRVAPANPGKAPQANNEPEPQDGFTQQRLVRSRDFEGDRQEKRDAECT